MSSFFDFKDMSGAESVITRRWNEFRSSLAAEEFQYDEVEKAKETTFLKVYDDLFYQNHGIKHLSKRMVDLSAVTLGRGSILGKTETVSHERFLPKSEFIRSENRFSPAGVEWLYLALGASDEDVLFCSKKECRVNVGDRFGFCNFIVEQEFEDLQIVDLTTKITTFEQINETLEANMKGIYNQAVNQGIQLAKAKDSITKDDIRSLHGDKTKQAVTLWAVDKYTKLLSEQIFRPISDVDKKIEYAPFQTMAQYFISLGFSGIIYSSTVSEKGKNLVLFDKRIARPVGTIKDCVVK